MKHPYTFKVLSDYYLNSQWKPVIKVTTASTPAIAGYLQVRRGQHYYPMDVIVGYVVGAAIL